MAIRTTGAFLAGAVAGWTARSFFGSSREALVLVVRYTEGLRDHVMREVAAQAEWFEDLVAEGRARYEHVDVAAPMDESVPPRVVGVPRASSSRRPAARGRT